MGATYVGLLQSVIVGTVGAPAGNYVVSRLAAYNIVPSRTNRQTDVGGSGPALTLGFRFFMPCFADARAKR